MITGSIAAVFLGPVAGQARDAVAAQSLPVRLATDGLAGGEWLWLLDAAVIPRPDALARLVQALGRVDGPEPPALAASRVLTATGKLDLASLPVPEIRRPERVLSAVGHGCVSLRAARSGSLLVRAAALRDAGVRDVRGAGERDLEWTARLLRRAPGLLVPASVALRSDTGPDRGRAGAVRAATGARRLTSRARLLAELEPVERLWFLSHLVEHRVALRRLSRGRGAAG